MPHQPLRRHRRSLPSGGPRTAPKRGRCGGGGEEGGRAKLIIYGPFTTGGAHTTESNAAFDQSLRARDPSWGYRDIEADLGVLAQASGLELVKRVEMPANNFLLVYSRSTA